MNRLLLLLLIIGLAFLQVVALPRWGLLFVRPDLVLLGIIAWGLVKGPVAAAWGGLTGALLLDLMSEAPLGTSLIGLLPALVLLILIERWLTSRSLLVAMAVAFAVTATYDTTFLLILESLGRHVEWGSTITSVVLPAAILNTLLMPLICGIVWWIVDKTTGQEPSAVTEQGSGT